MNREKQHIVQDNDIEIEIWAFTTIEGSDVKAFSFKVKIMDAYNLSLNEIKDKAIIIAKEKFEKMVNSKWYF
ncbi:hypothetical protein [Xenorhabdus bharatensis]|uniref:hypothetical protein n=1 Tax=Xenorhabdus bharatensis TaxID=3136256 RepID=UPI0030F4530C